MEPKAKYLYGPCIAVGCVALWVEMIGFFFGAPRVVFAGCAFFGAGILTAIGIGNFICDYVLPQKS